MLKILYFAGLREALDCAEESLEKPQGVDTLGALHAHLVARGEKWQALAATKNLRMAVNQQMAAPDAAIRDGDEVAFFPPVTGG